MIHLIWNYSFCVEMGVSQLFFRPVTFSPIMGDGTEFWGDGTEFSLVPHM